MKYNAPYGSIDPDAPYLDRNTPALQRGSVPPGAAIEQPQREIVDVIEKAGLVPDPTLQLWEALLRLGLTQGNRNRRWMAVISMTTTAPPGAPVDGDTYLIPLGATGAWAAQVGKIAEWTGSAWSYVVPPDGHGISLPDGRIFERIGSTYVEKLAVDVQSGKWLYAVAGGTANALTVALTPALAANVAGVTLRIKIAVNNTGAATLDAGGGALPIVTAKGEAISHGDLVADAIMTFICTGPAWMLAGIAYGEVPVIARANTTFYVRADGNDANDGLDNTAGRAFRQIQRAIEVASAIVPGGYSVTILVGPGTFSPFIFDEGLPHRIVVDGAGPTTVVDGGAGAYAVGCANGKELIVRTLKLEGATAGGSTSGQLRATHGARIQFGDVEFGNASSSQHMVAVYGGAIESIGPWTISGNAATHIAALQQARVTLRHACTLVGARTFANAFAAAGGLSAIDTQATFSTNVATGQRYWIVNSIIDTQGAGANYFPGNAPGTAQSYDYN